MDDNKWCPGRYNVQRGGHLNACTGRLEGIIEHMQACPGRHLQVCPGYVCNDCHVHLNNGEGGGGGMQIILTFSHHYVAHLYTSPMANQS